MSKEKKSTIVKMPGDPHSELNIHRVLRFLRETDDGSLGDVYLPKSMVEGNPVYERAVAEFDWLHVKE